MDTELNNEQPIIAVCHDGIFHSDEVLACALLRIAAGDNHVSIIRSRLPRDWERADFVIDVGGKYDFKKFFDHHQAEGGGIRDNGLSYSAFGLMWKHFGVTAVKALLEPITIVKLTDPEIASIVASIEPFVMAIDSHDQASLNVTARHAIHKSVYLEAITVQGVISGMNPIPMIEESNEAANSRQFYKALDFAQTFLRRFILRKISKELAYAYTISQIMHHCVGGVLPKVLVLDQYCEWHGAVADHNAKAGDTQIVYVVYPSVNGKSFAIQSVKRGGGQSTTNNLIVPFPVEWAGLNDAVKLIQASGVSTALFCHRDRFIASASTLAGAVELAQKSINIHEHNKKSNR